MRRLQARRRVFSGIIKQAHNVVWMHVMSKTPLWGAGDQAARLAELTAGTEDRAKELPLRRDVRSLGMLLGQVLVEQAGEPLFKTVEQLRRLLIQSRAHSARSQSRRDEMSKPRDIVDQRKSRETS